MPGRPALAAGGLLIAACALRLLAGFHEVGLVTPDAYPLLAASRAGSPAEWLGVLAIPLGGDWLDPVYYRPAVHSLLALEYAVFGLRPFGYLLGSVLLFAASAAAVGLLAARLLGGKDWGAVAALACFALHPVHAVVVPAVSRRPELLCVLFVSLSLAAQARSAARFPGRPALGAGGLAALALASKETAFVLPPLAALVAWTLSPPGSWRTRARLTAVAIVPQLVAALAFVALRVAVLGAFLGERPLRSEGLVGASAAVLRLLAERLVSGRAAVADAPLPTAILALGAVVAALAVVLAPGSARSVALRRAAPAALVGVAWVGISAVLYAVGLGLQPWYLLFPAGGLALVAGALLGGLLELARRPEAGRAARGAAALALLCVVAVGLGAARYSPVWRDYPQWNAATRTADDYLRRVRDRVAGARDGSAVRVAYPPFLPHGLGADEPLEGVFVLAPYSVGAWAALAIPSRSVRVQVPGEPPSRPRPEEVVVRIRALGLGGARRAPPQGR